MLQQHPSAGTGTESGLQEPRVCCRFSCSEHILEKRLLCEHLCLVPASSTQLRVFCRAESVCSGLVRQVSVWPWVCRSVAWCGNPQVDLGRSSKGLPGGSQNRAWN